MAKESTDKNKTIETHMIETFHGFTIITEPSLKTHLMDVLERKGVQIREASENGKEAYIYICASKSRRQFTIDVFNELKKNDFRDLDSETNQLPY